jgi:hypothetical protein
MAHRSVPGSELLVGVDFERHPRVQALLRAERPVVLFPAPLARDARELAARADPLTVFVIDGTWWQAQKIWRRNPALQRLPVYRLDPERPSAYQIRAEPEPHCVSTLEAVSYLLDAIDGAPGRHAGMVAPLQALVERQLGFSGSAARTPRRKVRAEPRPARLPPPLEAKVERAMVFYAEGNGWPASAARQAELVQWLALRPATGERFECFVEPPQGRSPTMQGNLELCDGDLERMVPVAEFRKRWAAFVRPQDVGCGWGHFPSRLLMRAGLTPPSHVDLRVWCNERLRGRMASLEHAHRAMGLPPAEAWSPGRGGRRMALLVALFRALAKIETVTTAGGPPV